MEHKNTNWQSVLYNGLVTDSGRPAKVSSGAITKPNYDKQLSERMPAQSEIIGDNFRNRGLLRNHKQRFSVHRSLSFLPQE